MKTGASPAVAEAVSPEEVGQWREHRVTLALLADLQARRTDAVVNWGQKAFQRDTAEATAMANAEALGGVQVLQTLIEFLQGEA